MTHIDIHWTPVLNKLVICGLVSCWSARLQKDSCFEASSLHFDRHHLGYLDPEVTIFGEGEAYCR